VSLERGAYLCLSRWLDMILPVQIANEQQP
jgi:hypothetical protein